MRRAVSVRLVELWSGVPAVDAVRGWRIVCATGAAGAVAWAVLATLDGLVGRRAAGIIGLGLLGGLLSHASDQEASRWSRDGFVHAVRVDGRAPTVGGASRWRGVLGLPCGQPTIFKVDLDGAGVGGGVAQNYTWVPSLVLAVALAPLDGPYRTPIRAW